LSEDPFLEIDHVQLAMPSGGEERARRFFVDVLGMTEIAKPPELAKRGGCWFASGKKFRFTSAWKMIFGRRRRRTRRCAAMTASLPARIRTQGIETIEAEDIPGVRRCHIFDPFGNRIELVAD